MKTQTPNQLPPQETKTSQRNCSPPSLPHLPKLRSTALLAFILLHSSSTLAHAAPPPELTVLRQQYDRVLAEKATAPFEAALTLLNGKFTTALENAATTAQQNGKLDDVLAIQDDKKRLAEKLPIPDDDEKTPDALKPLRAIYREQLKKLEDTRAAAITSVLPAYQTRLQDLEVTLTKAGRIDEAKELRTYREGLAIRGVAVVPYTTPSPSTTADGSTPGTANISKVKGDDRKAAEWLLTVGGHFEIDERGKRSKPTTLEDLPKGKFSVTSIDIDGREAKSEIKSDGLANLRGLQSLRHFSVDYTKLTTTDLDFLSTCSGLNEVAIKRGVNITDAFSELLVPLTELRRFNLTDQRGFTGASLGRLGGLRELNGIEFINCAISDEGAANVALIPSVTFITFEGCRGLTDAGLAKLAKMPKLAELRVANTSITAEGLAAAKLKLTSLDFNKLGGTHMPRETAAIIGPAYPGVKSVRFAQSETLQREDLEALAHFKSLTNFAPLSIQDASAWAGLPVVTTLESLIIDRNPFTDAEVDHLLRIPNINSLNLGTVDVTDAGLLKLAGMKKLKRISLKPCPKVTDAGIAALKKQRPDIQIIR